MISIDPPSSSGLSHPVIAKQTMARFLGRARRAAGLAGSVDVLLTTDVAMRRLNRRFRGKDKATDVLSFPAAAEAEGFAGDLAISLDTAARQARRFGHSLELEVRVLLLHGLLHLKGMDHEADAGEMSAEESRLRAELRLPLGLVERAGQRGPALRIAENAGAARSRRAGRASGADAGEAR